MVFEVERKIHFYRVEGQRDDDGNLLPYDPVPVLNHINTLPEETERRLDRGDGNSSFCWIHRRTAPQRLRLATVRRSALPSVETRGRISFLPLDSDAGLADMTHVVFFDENIAGADFNFYGPRLNRLEFWGTALATGVLVVWGYKFDGNQIVGCILEGDRSTIYGTLASIFASLFGFTLAAFSFVVGLSNRSRLYHLRTSEQYKTLRKAFMSAIWWLGFATIISLVGLIADRGDFPIFALVYFVAFSAILVSFRVANCVLLLGLIVDVITQPSKAQSGGPR